MKTLLLILITFVIFIHTEAQPVRYTFKPPQVAIRFNADDISQINSGALIHYRRVSGYCPTDGHYTYSSYTSRCFRDDWHTVEEDHTPGDAAGNMMLVNASPQSGTFLITRVDGLKSGVVYEFALWLMNLCKITEKCPFPLLPDIVIRLQTPSGKVVATLGTGKVQRHQVPHWTPHRAVFTMPASETSLLLHMTNNNPGGCGNDFAVDDITFRERVTIKPVVKKKSQPPPTTAQRVSPPSGTKPKTAVVTKPAPTIPKPLARVNTSPPVRKQPKISKAQPLRKDTLARIAPPLVKRDPPPLPPPPAVLRTRVNVLVKRIEIDPGEIRLDLYDNGEIDGDTISIYHNNRLLVSRAKLSAAPITFRIAVHAQNPHHELVMVANNLGSIPPNTSVMVVTAGGSRAEVFISSTQQKNAKVVLDLKK